MGIALGLLAAFGFGTADFIARGSTRRIGTMRTLFYMQFVGAIAVTVYLLASGEFARVASVTQPGTWLLAVGTALVGIFASMMLYRSFEVGIISIVSPVAASYAAVTVVLALLSGEQLTAARVLGVVASLGGVILSSISKSTETELEARRWRTPPGLGFAIAAAIGFGVSFYLIGFYVSPAVGGIMPVWISRWTTIGSLLLLSLITGLNLQPPRGNVWVAVIAVGVLDTVGYAGATIGVLTEQVSIVTVLSSLFSAVTVVLAWIFLRESLSWWQWVGILTIFLGIMLVSI